MSCLDERAREIETMELDAMTVTGTQREILSVCAGRLVRQLAGALWTNPAAKQRASALAARAAAVRDQCRA